MVTPSAKYSSKASEANLAENINKNFSSRVNETEKPFKHGLGYSPNPLNPFNLLNQSNSPRIHRVRVHITRICLLKIAVQITITVYDF